MGKKETPKSAVTATYRRYRRKQPVTVELERSYVFPHESIPHILNFLGAQTVGIPLDIQDDYLHPNLRIRTTARKGMDISTIQLTRKSGDKSSGRRVEENRNIDPETAAILTADRKLRVIKQRYHVKTSGSGFVVTLDTHRVPPESSLCLRSNPPTIGCLQPPGKSSVSSYKNVPWRHGISSVKRSVSAEPLALARPKQQRP